MHSSIELTRSDVLCHCVTGSEMISILNIVALRSRIFLEIGLSLVDMHVSPVQVAWGWECSKCICPNRLKAEAVAYDQLAPALRSAMRCHSGLIRPSTLSKALIPWTAIGTDATNSRVEF